MCLCKRFTLIELQLLLEEETSVFYHVRRWYWYSMSKNTNIKHWSNYNTKLGTLANFKLNIRVAVVKKGFNATWNYEKKIITQKCEKSYNFILLPDVINWNISKKKYTFMKYSKQLRTHWEYIFSGLDLLW